MHADLCTHPTKYVVVRGQLVGVNVGQEAQTQVVMLDNLHLPTRPLQTAFSTCWVETRSLSYIAQGGLKLCLPRGVTGMRYHARLLMGFYIA